MTEQKDEMEQANEHWLHQVAEEELRKHNMPTVFSYRHAFILGYEKCLEQKGQK